MPITITILPDEGAPTKKSDAPKLTFDAHRVVIGRGAGSDVRLPDASVSQRHASVQAKGPEYTVIDEGSTNGSWVGGVKLSPRSSRTLRNGDLLRVGRVWLEVTIDQSPTTADLPAATRDLALALVAQAMRSLGDDTVPKVRVVEGPDTGATLALSEEGRVYRVGRGETCDLALADEDASREHTQLVRRGSTVLARDLGSKNGTTLGDQPVPFGRDATWRPAVMMRIGAHVLALEEPVMAALVDLESAPDEPMSADELSAPPPSKSQEAAAPPSARAAAPIARVLRDASTSPASRKQKGFLSSTDFFVVGLAVLVISLSVAGLVWLFRG